MTSTAHMYLQIMKSFHQVQEFPLSLKAETKMQRPLNTLVGLKRLLLGLTLAKVQMQTCMARD